MKFDMFLERFINRVHLFLSQARKTIHKVFNILLHQKPKLYPKFFRLIDQLFCEVTCGLNRDQLLISSEVQSRYVTNVTIFDEFIPNIRSYSKSIWLCMLCSCFFFFVTYEKSDYLSNPVLPQCCWSEHCNPLQCL